MYLPWPGRELERTCDNCRYAWRVPRQFARQGFRSISNLHARGASMRGGGVNPRGPDFSGLNAEVQAIEDINQEYEAFKSCPRCSSRKYTQRPVRRRAS